MREADERAADAEEPAHLARHDADAGRRRRRRRRRVGHRRAVRPQLARDDRWARAQRVERQRGAVVADVAVVALVVDPRLQPHVAAAALGAHADARARQPSPRAVADVGESVRWRRRRRRRRVERGERRGDEGGARRERRREALHREVVGEEPAEQPRLHRPVREQRAVRVRRVRIRRAGGVRRVVAVGGGGGAATGATAARCTPSARARVRSAPAASVRGPSTGVPPTTVGGSAAAYSQRGADALRGGGADAFGPASAAGRSKSSRSAAFPRRRGARTVQPTSCGAEPLPNGASRSVASKCAPASSHRAPGAKFHPRSRRACAASPARQLVSSAAGSTASRRGGAAPSYSVSWAGAPALALHQSRPPTARR